MILTFGAIIIELKNNWCVPYLVSFIALAPEHAEEVDALAEDAEVVEHVALVDVDARLLVAHFGVHEPHVALAPERAWIVEALAVLAQVRVVWALVYVLTREAVPPKPLVTHALKQITYFVKKKFQCKF